jgi:hypothetical protein
MNFPEGLGLFFTAETQSSQRFFFILLSVDQPSLKLWLGMEDGKQKTICLEKIIVVNRMF